MARSIKVLNTYLRGLRRLENLRNEVELLEEDVAAREAEAFHKILAQLDPLMPFLGRPLSIREPWLPESEERHYALRGLPVLQSFEESTSDDGVSTHHGRLLAVVEGGRLIEISMQGSWREGTPPTETSWRVQAEDCALTPDFAKAHLKPVLTGILDLLKDAVQQGRADRKALQQRLNLLSEVDDLLSIDGNGR